MRERTLEQRYPNARARRAADEAIDAPPMSATLAEAVGAWVAAYRKAAEETRR